MANEISDAFSHPEARAITLRLDGVFDRISLRDHIVTVEIGAFEVERGMEQRLSFNVVVEVADVAEPLEDDVDRILSYDRLTEAISNALAAQRVNLLETLAQDIAERILVEPQAERVFVRIEKLDKPAGVLGVEIVRTAAEVGRRAAFAEKSKPIVTRADSDIESIAARFPERPLLLVPPSPSVFTEAAENLSPEAERRIALLAWDQAAWLWAEALSEATVVSSRTEVEWGFAQGQMNVWAPMKQILDSQTPPEKLSIESLLEWVADVFEAEVQTK